MKRKYLHMGVEVANESGVGSSAYAWQAGNEILHRSRCPFFLYLFLEVTCVIHLLIILIFANESVRNNLLRGWQNWNLLVESCFIFGRNHIKLRLLSNNLFNFSLLEIQRDRVCLILAQNWLKLWSRRIQHLLVVVGGTLILLSTNQVHHLILGFFMVRQIGLICFLEQFRWRIHQRGKLLVVLLKDVLSGSITWRVVRVVVRLHCFVYLRVCGK